MKNAKNIQKITTSLFLAATLVLGSVSFAVPGIMPSAFAATENLYVSADNKLFDKSFNGPMVIEVVVNDNDIDDVGTSPEPDVTVNGATLRMIQSADGNWYAYIVEKTMAEKAVELFPTAAYSTSPSDTEPFSAANTDAEAVYADADIVVRQPKEVRSYRINFRLACSSGICLCSRRRCYYILFKRWKPTINHVEVLE